MVASAITIAKIMGPFLIILGLWLLLCKESLVKLRSSSDKSFGILYLAGCMNMLIGLVIIVNYNVWDLSLLLAVTLLGWYSLFRGIFILFMPGKFLGSKKPGTLMLTMYGLLPLVWGVILTWAGYGFSLN